MKVNAAEKADVYAGNKKNLLILDRFQITQLRKFENNCTESEFLESE
jgi:hypothetical protein